MFVAMWFWMLDAYYLRLERAFRVIYEDARNKIDADIDFCMTPDLGVCTCASAKLWIASIFSPSTF